MNRDDLTRLSAALTVRAHRTILETPELIAEMAARISTPEVVLRGIYDVEVELEPGDIHDVTSMGRRERQVIISHPQPHPPRVHGVECVQTRRRAQYDQYDEHNWERRGMRPTTDEQFIADIRFGDHVEKWYFDPALAYAVMGDDVDGNDFFEWINTAALAVMKAARQTLARVFRTGYQRRYLFPVNMDGRRLHERREYEHFLSMGDFPRPQIRTGFQVNPRTANDPETVADLAPPIRRQYEQDPVGFAQAVMGDWDPEVIGQEAARAAEAFRNVGVAAADAGRRIAQVFGRDPRVPSAGAFWKDGWFDQHSISMEVDARAEGLLLSRLTDAQRDEYQRLKRITVHAKSGRKYVLRRAWSYNVTQYTPKGDRPKRKMCVVMDTPHRLPMGDVLLTQMVLIRNDEARFCRTANSYLVDRHGEPLRTRDHDAVFYDEAAAMLTRLGRFPE